MKTQPRLPKLLLILAAAAGLLLMQTVVLANKAEPAAANLWLVKEGMHTSLILHTRDTAERLPLMEAQVNAGPLVMISWGDAAYYQTADKTLKLTLRALLLPTRAALNARTLQNLNEAPQTTGRAKLYPMTVSAEQLAQLLQRIRITLTDANAAQPTRLLQGRSNDYVGGRFYPAADRRYSLFYTCNTWVADVLTAADMPFSVRAAQLAGNLVLQHKLAWVLSSSYRSGSQFGSTKVIQDAQ